MKGIFIPEITVEMFRDGCLESIETLMTECEVYDIEYDPESAEPRKKGKWTVYESQDGLIRRCTCSECGFTTHGKTWVNPNYCSKCGADMRGEQK